MPFPIEHPTRDSIPDLAILVEAGTKKITLSSEGGHLPDTKLAYGALFCISGTTGGGNNEHPNHGLYIAISETPSDSEVKAIRLGESVPQIDTNMPNAVVSTGGRLYQHVGDRAIPQAAANGGPEVLSLKLGVQTDVLPPLPPPPE